MEANVSTIKDFKQYSPAIKIYLTFTPDLLINCPDFYCRITLYI